MKQMKIRVTSATETSGCTGRSSSPSHSPSRTIFLTTLLSENRGRRLTSGAIFPVWPDAVSLSRFGALLDLPAEPSGAVFLAPPHTKSPRRRLPQNPASWWWTLSANYRLRIKRSMNLVVSHFHTTADYRRTLYLDFLNCRRHCEKVNGLARSCSPLRPLSPVGHAVRGDLGKPHTVVIDAKSGIYWRGAR